MKRYFKIFAAALAWAILATGASWGVARWQYGFDALSPADWIALRNAWTGGWLIAGWKEWSFVGVLFAPAVLVPLGFGLAPQSSGALDGWRRWRWRRRAERGEFVRRAPRPAPVRAKPTLARTEAVSPPARAHVVTPAPRKPASPPAAAAGGARQPAPSSPPVETVVTEAVPRPAPVSKAPKDPFLTALSVWFAAVGYKVVPNVYVDDDPGGLLELVAYDQTDLHLVEIFRAEGDSWIARDPADEVEEAVWIREGSDGGPADSPVQRASCLRARLLARHKDNLESLGIFTVHALVVVVDGGVVNAAEQCWLQDYDVQVVRVQGSTVDSLPEIGAVVPESANPGSADVAAYLVSSSRAATERMRPRAARA